jgi:mono/diheme cytochrome c family protein
MRARIMGWAAMLLGSIAFGPAALSAQVLSAKGLSNTERSGLRVFLQHCAVCHLGVPPRYQTYGPPLNKDLVAAKGEAAVRKAILEGTVRMPGFQYGLKSAEVDDVLTYLKVLPKESVTIARPTTAGASEESK